MKTLSVAMYSRVSASSDSFSSGNVGAEIVELLNDNIESANIFKAEEDWDRSVGIDLQSLDVNACMLGYNIKVVWLPRLCCGTKTGDHCYIQVVWLPRLCCGTKTADQTASTKGLGYARVYR